MSDVKNRNEFIDLDFQIWRVKDDRSDKWRDEVYIGGNNIALQTLRDSLQSLLDIARTYGKGTKKYRCNPPADFDHVSFRKENGVQIQWLDMLVVSLGFNSMDDEPFVLDDFTVELSVNPTTLSKLIAQTQGYLNLAEQHAHGTYAVGGLRFSPDWVGTE